MNKAHKNIYEIGDRTKVSFASFLSGGFTIMTVINPPERKLAKRTYVDRGYYK